MDLNNIWNSFLNNIKLKINDIAYDTWFSETKLINLKDNIATVLVPYHIHKKSLSENYNDIIDEVFTEITGSNFKFNYVVEEEVENNITENNEIIGVPNNNETFENNLDSRYTFKNFIIGPSNKFAAKGLAGSGAGYKKPDLRPGRKREAVSAQAGGRML